MSTKPHEFTVQNVSCDSEESVECFPFRHVATIENSLENCMLLYTYILILYVISYEN